MQTSLKQGMGGWKEAQREGEDRVTLRKTLISLYYVIAWDSVVVSEKPTNSNNNNNIWGFMQPKCHWVCIATLHGLIDFENV